MIYHSLILRELNESTESSEKYHSKCIIAICAFGDIVGTGLEYCYAIATEEKLIFVYEDYGTPIEVTVAYEK